MIRVQFVILISLIFDVSPDHLFISVFTNRARKVTIGPELTSLQKFLHLWATSEYLTSRQAFDEGNDFSHAVCRH